VIAINGKHDEFRLGFLTAVEVADRGYVGGLLVTNRHGRPLEFQCTTPVKPNRTQQILYGPTLVPFILGELIGCTLIEKVSVKPHLVLTEQAEILEVRNYVTIPVACLADEPVQSGSDVSNQSGDEETRENRISPHSPQTLRADGMSNTVCIGRQRFRFHEAHQSDPSSIEGKASAIPRDADLREPFDRVREALDESMRSGG